MSRQQSDVQADDAAQDAISSKQRPLLELVDASVGVPLDHEHRLNMEPVAPSDLAVVTRVPRTGSIR